MSEDRKSVLDDQDPSDHPGSALNASGSDSAAPSASTASGHTADSGGGNLMRSTALMAAGTMVSRILGMGRAVVLAFALGTTTEAADAFTIANTVPNTIYILLAGGVLNAVLVPQISRAALDPDGGKEYLDRLITISLTLLLGATVLMTLAAPILVKIYSKDFDDQLLHLTVLFAYLCLPQVFFYGLYTLLGQILNAKGRFGAYMWAPVANNIVAIAGLLVFIGVVTDSTQCAADWDSSEILLLAGTATAGVVAQALVLVPSLIKIGFTWRPRWGIRGVGLGTASRVAGWTFAAVLISQLGYIYTSRVTSGGGVKARDATSMMADVCTAVGSAAPGRTTYDYSFLLFMLPHSLITVSLVTALFTRMSQAAAAKSNTQVRADLSFGLRTVGVATVLASAAMIALAPDITGTMFFKNSQGETQAIAWVTAAMAVGLVPFSAQYLFQRVFYAFEDAKTPFYIQIPVVLTWAFGNFLAYTLLPAQWIVVGVGLAMSVSNLFGAVLSAVILHRRLGHLDGTRVLSVHLRLVFAAVLAGVAAYATSSTVHTLLLGSSPFMVSLVALTLGGTILLALYYLMLRFLGVSELSDIAAPVMRKLGMR